jgi:hypothetical protein
MKYIIIIALLFISCGSETEQQTALFTGTGNSEVKTSCTLIQKIDDPQGRAYVYELNYTRGNSGTYHLLIVKTVHGVSVTKIY